MNEPDGWLDELMPLPEGAVLFERASEPLDVVVYFSDERANVERRVPALAHFLAPDGTMWSAVPDGSPTLDPDVVAQVGRMAGLEPSGTLEIASGWTATRLRRRSA